jgi:hypothetical protein
VKKRNVTIGVSSSIVRADVILYLGDEELHGNMFIDENPVKAYSHPLVHTCNFKALYQITIEIRMNVVLALCPFYI